MHLSRLPYFFPHVAWRGTQHVAWRDVTCYDIHVKSICGQTSVERSACGICEDRRYQHVHLIAHVHTCTAWKNVERKVEYSKVMGTPHPDET
jgi:hypothetical protein